MIPGLEVAKHQDLSLPSGKRVKVPVTCPTFLRSDVPNRWGYGSKPVLAFDNDALFPEIVVLRIFQRLGWSGVWVDSWKKQYLVSMPGNLGSVLSSDEFQPTSILAAHRAGFAKFSGAWDVAAWNEQNYLFCEVKRQQKDSIKDTQLRWLDDRLREGATTDNFLLVEWAFQR